MSTNKMLCKIGKFDIPIIQLQPPFVVDLLESNIALLGSAMTGKTIFLKTLVNILHKQWNELQEQIFILDFGGALAEYKDFPLVSAYFDNSNEEYVKRMFKILDNILKNNEKDLNGKNFRDSDEQLLHTTFLIDNVNAFISEPRYLAYQEKLAKLCRDGLSKGITTVMTAVDTKGITSYLRGFKQKIAFEMPQDKYSEIFNGKVDVIGNNPGHGFANVTVKPDGVTGTFRMNLPYEVQCTYPYGDNDSAGDTESELLQKVKGKFDYFEGQYVKRVKKYQTFPKELTRYEYDYLLQHVKEDIDYAKNAISVGLDYVDFYPVTLDFEHSQVVAIYGKKEFGKIPDCNTEEQPFTVFVIQSKLVYLNANENKFFMNAILPQLAAVAEERGYLFLFTDVQKINDSEQNSFFNNAILDNIAEFAGERGQKTIFGSMDVKSLKEDYARCEKGDGYYYDVEADRLMKLKFIKTEE